MTPLAKARALALMVPLALLGGAYGFLDGSQHGDDICQEPWFRDIDALGIGVQLTNPGGSQR